MRRLKYFLLILFLASYACREPFEFDYPAVENQRVVIDGFITDQGRSHMVRVSYSTSINERGLIETNFVTDATVRIEDDQGGFTQLLHTNAGIYRSQPQYAAQEGRGYRLSVTLSNGQQYLSEMKVLPAPSPARIDLSISGDTRPTLINNRIQQERGARVTSQIQRDGERHFYQWLTGHYYIFDAEQSVFFDSTYRFCYLRDFDQSRVQLFQDVPSEAGSATEFEQELDFIPVNSRMKIDFGVETRLLTLQEEDYNFWEKVKRLSENAGGLFDAAPFSLEGNITNSDNGELALGYFGVYRESRDRAFFFYSELGFPIVQYPPCAIPPGATFPHPCMDCRVAAAQENLGITRPIWWRN